MAYKIDKNIPLPESPSDYPVIEMEVGDSFFVPCDDEEHQKAAAKIRSSVQHLAKGCHPRRSMAVRRVEGGYRVWRIT